jgi:hypothetical protein
LAWFWLGFFWFFRFQTYKTETEPVGFFKILIGFFGFLLPLISITKKKKDLNDSVLRVKLAKGM